MGFDEIIRAAQEEDQYEFQEQTARISPQPPIGLDTAEQESELGSDDWWNL